MLGHPISLSIGALSTPPPPISGWDWENIIRLRQILPLPVLVEGEGGGSFNRNAHKMLSFRLFSTKLYDCTYYIIPFSGVSVHRKNGEEF